MFEILYAAGVVFGLAGEVANKIDHSEPKTMIAAQEGLEVCGTGRNKPQDCVKPSGPPRRPCNGPECKS